MPKAKDPNNPPPIGFDIALSANHPEFTQLLQMADIQSSGVKAGPLKASLKATGNSKNAKVSDLNAAWGNSSIAGNASYDATGAKPMIVANLKGGVVNLTPFMGGGGAKSQAAAPAPAVAAARAARPGRKSRSTCRRCATRTPTSTSRRSR